jgi:hypothetical protein
MNTTYQEAGQGRVALVEWCTNPGDTSFGVGGIIGTDTKDVNGWKGYFGNLRAMNAKGEIDPASSPTQNRWLRLKRVGQVFSHYWSYDGKNWVKYQDRDRSSAGPLPTTLLVGFASQVNDTCCGGAGIDGKPGIYSTETIRNLGDTVVTKPMITYQKSGSDLVLKWLEGKLQSSTTGDSGYTDVLVSGTNAPSPYTNAMTGNAKFFRLVTP